MKKNCFKGRFCAKAGFTLIELLVVVLIIGILAAVAVPQYQVAVGKAHLAKLASMASSVIQAEETYYLENGDYTQDWEKLLIFIPGTVTGNTRSSSEGWTIKIENKTASTGGGVLFEDSRVPNLWLKFYYQKDTTTWRGMRVCHASESDALANKLCRNLTNKQTRDAHAGTSRGPTNYYYF